MSADKELMQEAGVWYRFAKTNGEHCPRGMQHYHYLALYDGKIAGERTIFVLGGPAELYKLLASWNGQGSKYSYQAAKKY